MWFFLKRLTGQASRPANPALRYSQLMEGLDGEMCTALSGEHVALKFWLPEPVEAALEDLSRVYTLPLSTLVRALLVDYLYGRLTLAYLQERGLGIFGRRGGTSLSRARGRGVERTYTVPELGKNIAPIKVYVPQKLRDDLALLAEQGGVPLSQFAREVIIGAVLGRATLPERAAVRQIGPTRASEAWDRDEKVRRRTVDPARIGELRAYDANPD